MIHCEILIIDDDQEDIELLRDALFEQGVLKVHHVDTATNAFHYLEEVYPDCIPGLIVTDFRLPGMSGAEFLTDLRSRERYKGINVVIMSSSRYEQQIENLRKGGDLDFFLKPTTLSEYALIAEIIKKKIVA